MTSVGTRTIEWRGGSHDFCIAKTGDQMALEEKCGVGIFAVAGRLQSVMGHMAQGLVGGAAYVQDIRETIRLGLIGGGMAPAEANKVVALHVDGHPLAHSVFVAFGILEAALVGIPDDPVGKKDAAGAETGPVSSTTTAASAAQQSSESAPASAGQ